MPQEDTQFKKGQSGNPKGRPKDTVSLVTALKRHLREHPEDVKAVIEKTIDDAKKGDPAARKLVFDRIDGAVTQSLEHEGKLEVEVVFSKNVGF